MVSWDSNKKASVLWYVMGIIGIGNLIAIIYVLLSSSKRKLYSILYILGFIGPLIAYLAINDDAQLKDMSFKLMIGNIIYYILYFVIFATMFAKLGLFAL